MIAHLSISGGQLYPKGKLCLHEVTAGEREKDGCSEESAGLLVTEHYGARDRASWVSVRSVQGSVKSRDTHTWFFPFGAMNHEAAPIAAMTKPTMTTWKNPIMVMEG